ncbi:MAG: YjjG family noncanonical pyrimidine nucleotidase [Clostridia bacterium]|nr:YjjG family noncanonical pyrimidine nucleotidase [Clostridia bacterium]
MKYEFILFDADDTLFDFQKTAKKNFEQTCKKLGVPFKDGYYEIYRDINQGYWDLFSLGKVEKSVLKKMRFVDFGKVIGYEIDADEFMPEYESGLAKISILYPETIPLLQEVKKLGLKIYLITNGLANVQRGRLSLSGIEDFFDGIFISDEMGTSKPSKTYYDMVTRQIDGYDKNKALIVGDSLVSDMPLGIENGVDTCFFNPNGVQTELPITYQIKTLPELLDILK